MDYKTSEYQRRAYKKYISRKTDPDDEKYDPEWTQKTRDSSRRYYEKNKTKILEKLKQKRELKQTNPNG